MNQRLINRTASFAERVRLNQQKLRSNLKSRYDFIVCGSGSSGTVVAPRLAENADVSVPLVEAGGSDDLPSVMEASCARLVGSEAIDLPYPAAAAEERGALEQSRH